jgi:hypothetical protein
MKLKNRILDYYFLSLIKKKGIQASKTEVTQFFDEKGWRFYDLDSMMKNFIEWRKVKQKTEVGAD